jgi:hypothetical protein
MSKKAGDDGLTVFCRQAPAAKEVETNSPTKAARRGEQELLLLAAGFQAFGPLRSRFSLREQPCHPEA